MNNLNITETCNNITKIKINNAHCASLDLLVNSENICNDSGEVKHLNHKDIIVSRNVSF